MRKYFIILMTLFILQSCKEETLVGGPTWLYFAIEITDLEGKDLLDASVEGNLINGKSTYIDIRGNESNVQTYVVHSFFRPGSQLIIEKRELKDGPVHFAVPGIYQYSINSKHWLDDATSIIKWGEGIENDTIVFSGGWRSGTKITKITINGKELEKPDKSLFEHHFIYRKDMSKKE